MPPARKKKASATLSNAGVKKSQHSSKVSSPFRKGFLRSNEAKEDVEDVTFTVRAKAWITQPPRETIYPPPPHDVAKKLAEAAKTHKKSVGEWFKRISAKRQKQIADALLEYDEVVNQSTKEVPSDDELEDIDDDEWVEQGEVDNEGEPEPPSDAEILSLASEDEELASALEKVIDKSALRTNNPSLPRFDSLPAELQMAIVKAMITGWKTRNTDLYDTMYLIRSVPAFARVFHLIPDRLKQQLPSYSRVDRILSFVEVHCNFTPTQLNPYWYKVQTIWRGGIMPYAAVTRAAYPDTWSEADKQSVEIKSMWFRLMLFMYDGNNLQSMPRFLLRDIWECRRSFRLLESMFPVPPRDNSPVPSMGRSLSMGMIDTWLSLFEQNLTDRTYRERRRYLWRRDETEFSLSERTASSQGTRHTNHAAAIGNSLALACLYESRAYNRYQHLGLDPTINDITEANAQAQIETWSNLNYDNWITFVQHG